VIAVLVNVAHATVGCVEACLAGDFLFVLQIVLAIKLAAHTQEPEQLQMGAVMFFVQELLVELFATATLVIASNFMGGEITSNPLSFHGGNNYAKNSIMFNCCNFINKCL
jgi:hypothetical protein